jgi:hypothetical protein
MEVEEYRVLADTVAEVLEHQLITWVHRPWPHSLAREDESTSPGN